MSDRAVRACAPPKRRGHPPVDPWHSTPSVRAGLPTDRAAWLALVLPVIDAGKSHPDVARLLEESGHKVSQSAVMLWHRKLSEMQTAGTLPERSTPLPERRAGWREGMPLPTAEKAAEGGRKGAQTKAREKRKGARKGPGKGGKK